MQIAAFHIPHLRQAPRFNGAVRANQLALTVNQTNQIIQRIGSGFPFLFGFLDFFKMFPQGIFGHLITVRLGSIVHFSCSG